MSINVTLP